MKFHKILSLIYNCIGLMYITICRRLLEEIHSEKFRSIVNHALIVLTMFDAQRTIAALVTHRCQRFTTLIAFDRLVRCFINDRISMGLCTG